MSEHGTEGSVNPKIRGGRLQMGDHHGSDPHQSPIPCRLRPALIPGLPRIVVQDELSDGSADPKDLIPAKSLGHTVWVEPLVHDHPLQGPESELSVMLIISCIIVTFFFYFEPMITGAFDREGQKAGKKNSEDRMQETESMSDTGAWILEIPGNQS